MTKALAAARKKLSQLAPPLARSVSSAVYASFSRCPLCLGHGIAPDGGTCGCSQAGHLTLL
jgi:hypothetical protein